MTYASGGLIEATDYNTRAANINSLWGVGTADRGYGQTTTVSNVSVSSTVTASQWATLIARLDSLIQHQSNTTSGITQPVAGNTITYLSALDTKITQATNNRLTAFSTGTAQPTALGNPLVSNSTAWITSATKEFSVTFTSTDTVRYFFNAGGLITSFARVNSGTTTKATDWNTFLTNTVGTISIGPNSCSRSGTGGDNLTLNTSVGYWNLTTSYQTLFSIGSTSVTADYGSNFATVEARLGATTNIVFVRYILYDTAADTFDDTVAGTTAVYAGYTPPETTYLSNVWGTPTSSAGTNTQS